jgi:methyl-accepting chemotaxis protein
MQDKRASPRREIARAARIELGDGTAVECTLSDVSQTGARVAIEDAAAVPDEFVLVLRDDLRRRCRAIRRDDGSLGVMFVANPAMPG